MGQISTMRTREITRFSTWSSVAMLLLACGGQPKSKSTPERSWSGYS